MNENPVSKKVIKLYKIPPWHRQAVKRSLPSLPFSSNVLHYAFGYYEWAFQSFVDKYEQLPERQEFSYLTGEEFGRRITHYAESKKPLDRKGVFSDPHCDHAGVLALAEFWKDIATIVSLLNALARERGMRLLDGFYRCSRTKDCYGLALAGRALLELGVYAATGQSRLLRSLKNVDETIANSDDPLGVMIKPVDFEELEEDLYRTIWGTRLYSGKVEIGKRKVSIWDGPELPSDWPTAKNIMTAFQGRAKRMKGEVGLAAYRIYEILCDVVHPVALGYQMVQKEVVQSQGAIRVLLEKGESHKDTQDLVVGASTFAAYHGVSLILEVAQTSDAVCPRITRWAQKHIDNAGRSQNMEE